jgi:hypothetical protein
MFARFEVSSTINLTSSNTIKLSVFWLLCFVGYLVYMNFGLGIDVFGKVAYEGSRSYCWGNPWQIMKVGISIGPISTLGIPMLAVSFLVVSFNVLLFTLHGFGSLVQIHLQQNEGQLSIFLVVTFYIFLAAGIIGIILLASRNKTPFKSTTGNQERLENTFSIHDEIAAASTNCFCHSRG